MTYAQPAVSDTLGPNVKPGPELLYQSETTRVFRHRGKASGTSMVSAFHYAERRVQERTAELRAAKAELVRRAGMAKSPLATCEAVHPGANPLERPVQTIWGVR